jgi:hypothetical protein
LAATLCNNTVLKKFEIHDMQVPYQFLDFLTHNKTLKYFRTHINIEEVVDVKHIIEGNTGLDIFDIPNTKPNVTQMRVLDSIQNVKVYYYTDRI